MSRTILSPQEIREGWRLLFDGCTLNGWTTRLPEHSWSVNDDGTLLCRPGKGQYLYTEESFSDFVLSIDFRIDPGVNSGVFLRLSDMDDPINTALEIQILDSFGEEQTKKDSCGAIYDLVAPRAQACKPAGEWNNMLLTCDGPQVSVVLNEEPVAEMNLDLWTNPGKNPDGTANKYTYAWKDVPRRGRIMLQDYGSNKGLLWFRNIKLKGL